jgi:TonB family protein
VTRGAKMTRLERIGSSAARKTPVSAMQGAGQRKRWSLGQDIAPRWLLGPVAVRVAIATAVVVLHVLLLFGPVSSGPAGAWGLPEGIAPSIQVVLLPEIPAAPLEITPQLRRIRVRLAELPAPAQGFATSRALVSAGDEPPKQDDPGSPPFEQLIVEARPQDTPALRDFCVSSYPPNARPANEAGTVVLLVRIEADGHVSDMKVEQSSGSIRLDRVTQACVIGALFEPYRAGLRAVPSWQRMHWTWAPSS